MSTKFVPGLAPVQRSIILFALGLVFPSPGVAKIKGSGAPRNWDIRQGYGIDGASLFYKGAGLAEFDVDIFIWEPEHWVQWEIFATVLTNPPSPPGVIPTTLGIAHPILNRKPWLINKVVVNKAIGLWESNDTGLWSVTIPFIEYRKARPVLLPIKEGPPGIAGTAVATTKTQQAIAAQDAANAALRAKNAVP